MMPKPKISASAQRVLDQIKARKQEENRKQREEERKAARAAEPPKIYFVEPPAPPWEPKPKPPQDPKGKFKCGHCGDKCNRVCKHFVGRVNKQGRPLYWLLCHYCNRCFYGNLQDFLHEPGAQYPDNEVVLAAARKNGTLEQYSHKNLVTFKEK